MLFDSNNSVFFSITVCNAGFYRKRSNCVLCPEKSIKSAPGDATECDTTCDGESYVPNDAHTACGKTVVYKDVKILSY